MKMEKQGNEAREVCACNMRLDMAREKEHWGLAQAFFGARSVIIFSSIFLL